MYILAEEYKVPRTFFETKKKIRIKKTTLSLAAAAAQGIHPHQSSQQRNQFQQQQQQFKQQQQLYQKAALQKIVTSKLNLWGSCLNVSYIRTLYLEDFSRYSNTNRVFSLNNEFLNLVGRFNSELTTLVLKNCQHITDQGMEHVSINCTSLTSLGLPGTSGVSTSCVSLVCSRLALIELDLSGGFSGGRFEGLASKMDEEDDEDAYPGDLEVILPNCLQLQVLNIDTSGDEEWSDLHDISPITNCKHLTELNMSLNREISVESFRQVCESCTDLTKINLQGCHEIVEEGRGIQILAEHCTKLISLSVGWLYSEGDDDGETSVDDADILTIATFPNLETLVLSNCDKITDFGLKELAETCTTLRSLDLADLRKGPITDEGLYYLRTLATSLTFLNLGEAIYCSRRNRGGKRGISSVAVSRFKAALPQCEAKAFEYDDY